MPVSRKIRVPPEKVRALHAKLAAAKDVHERVNVLAHEAGLEAPRVFEAGNVDVVAYAEGYDYGGYEREGISERGIIGISNTFKELPRSVQNAILAHELGHLAPLNRRMANIETALRISSWGFFAGGCVPGSETIAIMGIAIALRGAVAFLKRRIECHADEFSARLLGKEGILETLEVGQSMGVVSTPSIEARIRRIQRLFSDEE